MINRICLHVPSSCTSSYLNTLTPRVTARACVVYLTSRPPRPKLLAALADPKEKRVDRFFVFAALDALAAEDLLLNDLLRWVDTSF